MATRAALRKSPPPEVTRAASIAAARIGRAMAGRGGPGSARRAAQARMAEALESTILDAVRIIAAGGRVSVRADEEMLTTQQAAELLNVSRPYVVKLIESGKLPAVKVGRYRRLSRAAVQRYRDAWVKRREATLDELAELSQKSRLGY